MLKKPKPSIVVCSEAYTIFELNFKTYFENASSPSRLDDLYSCFMMGNQKYQELWQVIKLSLILSHGNATVESGISINKN